MQLYGIGRPSRATRVAWALEEADAEWDYVATSLRASSFLEHNPLAKVPCLVDGDLVLTESSACCTWVGTQHPESGLVPTDPHDRARYDMWCSFITTELEQPLWTKAKHKFALPAELRTAEALPGAAWDFARATRALVAGLGDRDFLVGDRFTCADLLCAHTLVWARTARFDVPEALERYARLHLARPALARASAIERGAG